MTKGNQKWLICVCLTEVATVASSFEKKNNTLIGNFSQMHGNHGNITKLTKVTPQKTRDI